MAPATIAMLLLLAACGDDDDSSAPTEQAEDSAFQETITEAQDRLSLLDSYAFRTNLTVELPNAGAELGATTASVQARGEAIPPDRLYQTATSTLGDISAEEELITVPDGDFVSRGGDFTPGKGELQTSLLSVPSLWSTIASVSALLPPDPESEDEIVEGVESLHYFAEDIRLLFAKDLVLHLFGAVDSADALPDRYSVELWLSREQGVLLRILVSGERDDPRGGQSSFRLESSISEIGDDFDIALD